MSSRAAIADRRGRGLRPGVTFLEAVFATVLLGMVATTLAGLQGALRLADERQRQQLGAAEMANRLIIIQSDDPTLMPQESVPVWYGPEGGTQGFFYRWSLTKNRVKLELSDAARETSADRRSSVDFARRVEVVTVRVWLSEESGGSMQFRDNIPRATVSRLLDKLAFVNKDREERRLAREGIGGIMESMIDAASSEGGAGGGVSIGVEQQPRGGGDEERR